LLLLFNFTDLDIAERRKRERVQPIFTNIFLELARRLSRPAAEARGGLYVQWGSVSRPDLVVTKGEPHQIAHANRIRCFAPKALGALTCFSNTAQPRTRSQSGNVLDLLLHVVHHRYGGNQNNGRDYLVRVKTGVEEAPSDADGGECLHHFEVTGC
jgi:hypothetical protein